ncbi:MAG: hypothetical protein ACON38_19935 [Akkermansiaceae bacterium]
MKVFSLLALISLPLGAQTSQPVPATSIRVPAGAAGIELPPEVQAAMARAGDPGKPAAAPSSSQKNPEAYRADLLTKLTFNRTPSGILEEQAKPDAAPNVDAPAADNPDTDTPEKEADEDQKKRDQYQKEVEAFQRDVILGNWTAVKDYLATLPGSLGKAIYTKMIVTLSQPVKVQPRRELLLKGARAHSEKNYFSIDDLIGLSDASPEELTSIDLSRLATLVPEKVSPEFFARLEQGTRYFGKGSSEQKMATTALLLDAKYVEESGKFLPDLEEARAGKSHRALNLIARYHAEAHQQDLGKEHLAKAWEVSLEVLSQKDASIEVLGEALYRAVSLVADLEEGSGEDWLQKTFSDKEGEGFGILSTLATVGSQARMVRDANYRLETARLQASAAEAVLAAEGLDLSKWKSVFTAFAMNWLHEAQHSEKYDRSTSMRPERQYDPFGNLFYMQRQQTVSSNRNQPNAIPVGDLLDIVPSEKWISTVDETVRLQLLDRIPGLYLKVKEHQEALPYIRQVAVKQPERAIGLVKNLINVWAENHNPNKEQRYRSAYSYYYGYNSRAQTIPLTRSKQERNLNELAGLVKEVRDLGLEETFDQELTSAFITVHSKAEVWRLEALETVFGDLNDLDADTLASLIERMRINLAALWPNPKLQEEYKTKRTDREKDQQVMDGYALAARVTKEATEKYAASSRLLTQLAAVSYEKSNYLSAKKPQADHSVTKKFALEDLQSAAELYAKSLPLEKESDESTAVYETWFFAALGSPLLEALKNHHQPVPSEYAKIKAALESLPEESRERHLERFARTLNSRITNVAPDLKFRFLEAALQITGERDEMATSVEVYDYYKDLVTEIELVSHLDGNDKVGREAFGLFVNLHHTSAIERESGGFQRYLQNQNNTTSYSYNFGRPTEDYRDKFEKAARSALQEHFEIVSLTFHTDKVESYTSSRPGWRTTPYAYFLLKSKGPQVDTIPPLKIDLDFLDTTGYVVLPVTSASIPVDSSGEQDTRPFRELKVTMTLDEREAEEKGEWHLDVKTSGEGLVPDLDELLDLPPAGFEVVETDDQDLQIEELTTQTDDGAPLSTHQYRLTLKPKVDSPTTFAFPVLTEVATKALAKNDALLRQRYHDVDLLAVGEVVDLVVKPSSTLWLWIVAGLVVIAGGGFFFWSRKRGSGMDEGDLQVGPPLPVNLTPVTLLYWLRRLEGTIPEEKKAELQSEITSLESQAFGEGTPSLELEKIARSWSQ